MMVMMMMMIIVSTQIVFFDALSIYTIEAYCTKASRLSFRLFLQGTMSNDERRLMKCGLSVNTTTMLMMMMMMMMQAGRKLKLK